MSELINSLDLHYLIIIVAVVVILLFQLISLIGTARRMWHFSKIFGGSSPYDYDLKRNDEGETIGFYVKNGDNGNPYFQKMNASINDYVENNESIDFQLLKDTVDGTCDSIEEDVHTQIPIPLYLGLAGTMAGIIIGVGYLWLSGALESLLSVNPNQGTNNTEGIVVLLGGVAIAMICSIIGLLFTTICTWIFKGCKLSIEQRKSDLFAWMQQNLLPEVATDDMQAISKISRSLISFNNTFKQHSDSFAQTLMSVRTIMTQQKALADTVAQMGKDATEMAKANAIATQRLEQNAEKLEKFNDYLDSINGYVDEVHRFTENFKDENLRLGALEEIRDFFLREKKAIDERTNLMKKKVGEFDKGFKDTMKELKSSMEDETKELQKIVGQRTLAFETALEQQKELFVKTNEEILSSMKEQLKVMPESVAVINNLKNLPNQITQLLSGVENANKQLMSELRRALPAVVIQRGHENHDVNNENGKIINSPVEPLLPTWLKILMTISIIIITCCCIFNSYNTWQMSKSKEDVKPSQVVITDSVSTNIAQQTDSI